MAEFPIGFSPVLSVLSPEDKARIADSALTLLNDVGMTVMHDEAIALLKGAGGHLDPEGRVHITPDMVRQALKTVPNRIQIFNREGETAMDLGGRRPYFGNGSDLIYALDGITLEREHCRLAHVEKAALVADALDNIDFIMSFAHPNEIAPQRAYLVSFLAMAENSIKPIVNTAECRDDLAAIWQVSCILRGGEDALKAKPYWVHYAEPISPLKHPFNSVDKLLFCAQTAMPVIYSPAPISGSTAPITMAGHVAQGLAESFCGLVIHQLKAPGAPFVMGMGAAVLDMATGQCSYNAPEYYMAYLAMVEMSHHFDIPNWGYAGTSDAQLPDQQAAVESGMLTLMAALIGSNLNHDVGYLDFGRTGSLEMMVIGDEVIDQVRRIMKGIPVDDATLAADVVAQAGPAGQFLTHPHTMQHLRSTQWRPRLFCRDGFDKWQAKGGTTLLQRARTKLDEIVANHQPVPIAAEKLAPIRKLVDGFKVEQSG